MSDFKSIGNHDTGFWDWANPVKAETKPFAQGLSVSEALAKAKAKDGAELLVVKEDGTANLHSLSIPDTWSWWPENKTVQLSDLDRDPAKKQDKGKTPLAVDNFIAQEFGGKGAFLVDEKNKSTFLGGDVDQTTTAKKLEYAEEFLKRPTQQKVNTAYSIAIDAGQERHVDRALAMQVISKLKRDYEPNESDKTHISYLKPGATKVAMEGLLGNLTSLAGEKTSRVNALETELSQRTDKWKADLNNPVKARDQALSAWRSANRSESQKVETAAYNLREARMPDIHRKEQIYRESVATRDSKKSDLNHAVEQRVKAQSYVNELERLPISAAAHRQKADQLNDENDNMYMHIQTYTTMTLSSLSSDLSRLSRSIRNTEDDLRDERNKPTRPTSDPGKDPFSGGGNSVGSDPYGKDPFSGGGSSDDPYGKDPFNGGGSDDPYGKDPFNGGGDKYRDPARVDRLERELSTLKLEAGDLDDRISSLENINLRLAYTQDVDQLSLLFGHLDPIDRLALTQYKDKKAKNESAIRSHLNTARSEQSRYDRNINGAHRSLSNATSAEETARVHFGQAEARVNAQAEALAELKANPRPDTHAEVKPFKSTYDKAVAHKTATVGPQAPLTQKRDQTQAVVDKLNGDFDRDKRTLQGNITNVQQTLRGDALDKIKTVERGL